MFKIVLLAVLVSFMVGVGGATEKESMLLRFRIHPVAQEKVSDTYACMQVNRCAVSTRITEDKKYLVMEFSPEVDVGVKVSIDTQEQLFVEVATPYSILLIIDSNRDGLADSVQLFTPDAKVVVHERGSDGWAGGQGYYNEVMDIAFIYAMPYRLEKIIEKIEKLERLRRSGLFEA